MTRHPGRSILRATALALALFAAAPASAQFPFPVGQLPFDMRARPDAAAKGREAEDRGDLAEALAQYGLAVDETSGIPVPLRDEHLRTVLPSQARVALALGKLEQAEAALQRLAALPDTPRPRDGGTGLADVRQIFGAIGQFAGLTTRAMNQRLYVEGDQDAVDELAARLAFRIPPTDVPVALWAELRARQGRRDDVVALWRTAFPEWRDRYVAAPELARSGFGVEPTIVAWRLSLALRAVGAQVEAGEAMKAALDLDRARLGTLATRMPLIDVQLGGVQQRRWLATSAAELALSSGRQADAEQAIGAIASAKGLVNRFLQRRHALLIQIDSRASRGAREKLAELDAQLLQMPTDGAAGTRAVVDWQNGYAKALTPVLPALAQAGLADAFEDERALLPRIRRALAPDESLIGVILYQPVSAVAPAVPAPWRYMRYTLTATGATLQDLGARRELDKLVTRWRGAADDASREPSAHAIAAILLARLPADVQASRHWIVDPDGGLDLLPLEAMPDPAGGLVLQRHGVRYVSTLAQMADQALPSPAATGRALIVADPAYPAGAAFGQAPHLPMIMAQGEAWRDARFLPLPETRAEATAVQGALRAMGVASDLLTGADATPESLRRRDAPAFLHVASHGFLLSPAPEVDTQTRLRVRMLVPGLLSGLMLSPGAAGPVLTGLDLASLNLHGTRLVVLSACDTGNGSQDVFEGLNSLRRAAEEAGARATVTSLWPVPSAATTRLMASFYAKLQAGLSNTDALQGAKMELHDAGGGVREWAGFVLAGADR
jgi:CHAT domain-containing protein/tetratricopeptide (TPR) repeat protein